YQQLTIRHGSSYRREVVGLFVLKPVKVSGTVKIRRSEKVRITQASDLISGKSDGLSTSRDFHDVDGDFGGEAGSDHRGGPTTRVVAIEHQRNLPEVLLEECLLAPGEGTSHQRDDTWQPSLMDL